MLREELRIDPARTAAEIEELVRSAVARFGRRGVVLGLSGGLDSTVCAYLCQRVLGAGRVLAYILPERDSDPTNMCHAELVAQALHLPTKRIDLAPLLAQLGVYELVSREQAANRNAIEAGIRWLARLTGQPSAFSAGISLLYGDDATRPGLLARRLFRRPAGRIHAFAISKPRMRMIVLYYYAMFDDCLVAGTTDKSEWSIGFYDKYGDGANDVTLLRHLYKTQIRALAHGLGVPAEIIEKPSSGDLAAGLPNEAAIGLSYEQLDSALWAMEHGWPDERILAGAEISAAALAAIRQAMRVARIREELPLHL